MALVPTSCHSCVFGAVQSSILSLPFNVVGSVDVYLNSRTITLNGSTTVTTETTTISNVPASVTAGPSGSDTSVSTTTFGSVPTWVVSGVTLTYPTTYVHYLGFEGAAASTNTACAEPLIPSALTLPTSTDAASFIYPQVTGAATLPAGLLGYLDADGGIPSQLNGDQLTGCGAINVAVVSVASTTATFTIPPNVTLSELPSTSSEETTTATITSTSFSASTQTLTSETTVATTVSAESSSASETSVVEGTTLTAVSPVPVTTQQTVVTTQTISHQPAVFLNTITGAPIVPPSATQQSEVLDSTSASSAASASSASAQASALISNLFNVLGSLAASENAATSSQASESAAVSSSVAMASSVATTSSAFTLAPGPYTNGTSASALPSFLPSVYPTGTLPGNASGTTSPISYTGAAQKDLPGSFSLGGVLGVLAAALFL